MDLEFRRKIKEGKYKFNYKIKLPPSTQNPELLTIKDRSLSGYKLDVAFQ